MRSCGHREVVDAVRVPVIAAGGIMDGRGLMASLMLGVEGVLMGTKFIASKESAAPEFYKQALMNKDSDSTTITNVFTGLYARVLRNAFSQEYKTGTPVFPPLIQQAAISDITKASAEQNSGDYYPMYAGQGVGLIKQIPGSAQIVQTIIAEARELLASLPEKIRSF